MKQTAIVTGGSSGIGRSVVRQLLARQVSADAEAKKTAEVITSEAQRMADIVRKVGNITKYETKSYVGEAKILDLELASDPKTERERTP